MPISKNSFPKILRELRIDSSVINQIKDVNNSPYKIACDADFPQTNDINHSFKVFENTVNLLHILHRSKITIETEDYLLLFYASLLHDISKSKSSDVKNDIEKLKSLDKCCKLTADHGVISAHYIESKCQKGYIKIFGLKNEDVRKLSNMISFHNSGIIHTCFLPDDEFGLKKILLCLVFWLADVAEGTCDRALAAQLVNAEIKSPKSIARLGVDKVLVDEDNNVVVWCINRETIQLEQALAMSNSELSKHRLLLQAFGLPDRIVCLTKSQRMQKSELFLNHNDLISVNLCMDVSRMNTPLVLCGNTLPELYDKVAEAFCKISSTGGITHENYFGPVILEVKDVENDEADQIRIRSETGKDVTIIKDYTDKWLKDELGAEKDFYFGYTHGQRIYDYFYPFDVEDLNRLLDTCTKTSEERRKAFGDLMEERKAEEREGIAQFQHIIEILKKGPEARRAYVVIPNLIIDNPTSKFYIKEEMAPSLIAIQFIIEKDNKLSGFALLRSQELSTFFVVNYFEVKKLINDLIKELNDSFPGIKSGRIVMLSAFGYFDPTTPLLDKPELCKKEQTDYQRYACLDNFLFRNEFIGLLEEFKKDYIKIETNWCDDIKKYMKEGSTIVEAISKLKKNLDDLETDRGTGGHSITSDIREKKIKFIDEFIRTIKEVYNVNI